MMVGFNKNSMETAMRIPLTHTVGAEIGVWKGETSRKFLQRNLKHFYMVDPWSLDPWFDKLTEEEQKDTIKKYSSVVNGTSRKAFQEYYDRVYSDVVEKYSRHNTTILRTSSQEFFKNLQEELDWIYVDGDHAYEGALEDLNAALGVVKSGGIIFADDYGNKQGVTQAIDEFAKNNDLEFEVFSNNQVQFNLP